MRAISILLALAVTCSVLAEVTIEVIPPAVIGEDLTATWTVVVTNKGTYTTEPGGLGAGFSAFPPAYELIGVPAGCTKSESPGQAYCPGFTLFPNEGRELTFTMRYSDRFGRFHGGAALGFAGASAELVQAREFPVTTVADDGPGSLRQAITAMNAACAGEVRTCAIVFRIDGPVPAEGWFTIRVSSPLPPVTANDVYIDGLSQTLYTGNTNPAGPEVMLDGSAAWGHGLQIENDAVFISHLAIGNFHGSGIHSSADLSTRIERCHLGMDPGGMRRAPNGLRGAQVEGGTITVTDSLLAGNFRSGGWFDSNTDVTILRNRFTDNGASGFYARTPLPPLGRFRRVTVQDNVIAGNAHAGISLDRESGGNYAANHFQANLGRAIDIGIDGPTLAMSGNLPGRDGIVGAPAIVSARYENGETIIEARRAPRNPVTYLGETVYFYVSSSPKDGGELLGFDDGISIRHGDVFTLRVPRDLRGQWVSAATYAVYIFNFDEGAPGTSEVSEPRLVE